MKRLIILAGLFAVGHTAWADGSERALQKYLRMRCVRMLMERKLNPAQVPDLSLAITCKRFYDEMPAQFNSEAGEEFLPLDQIPQEIQNL